VSAFAINDFIQLKIQYNKMIVNNLAEILIRHMDAGGVERMA
jgi:hypothetical protein